MESASDKDKSYIDSTAKNYQSRHQKFSSWAEKDSSSYPAKKCRELLLHFLSLRILKFLQKESFKDDTIQEISILDAGCGSGRDLREFSKIDLSIPIVQNTSDGQMIVDNGMKCLNRSCDICDKVDFKEEAKFTNIKKLKILGTGFDICPGFVEQCQNMGLSVVLNDFVGFCKKLDEKDNLDVSPSHYHGIFTLASLFHLPRTELEKVLESFKSLSLKSF